VELLYGTPGEEGKESDSASTIPECITSVQEEDEWDIKETVE
jgi:hypothetical protein